MKHILVTGACGFLGSNVVKKLNASGNKNVIIIDNYEELKFKNLHNLSFIDYISYKQDIESLKKILSKYEISAILHIGANANVLERDPDVMMHANYEHSKYYLEAAHERNIPFIYASSSAIYGNAFKRKDKGIGEDPHNIYAWSKWLFDKHVTANLPSFSNKVIGLRLFNIFGMGEFHKGENASLPFRFFSFIQDKGFIDVFDKHIERDYVWVEDVADVFISFIEADNIANGIYDLGGNNPLSHLEIAELVANAYVAKGLKPDQASLIKTVPMPASLTDYFQFYTKAHNLLPIIASQTEGNKQKINYYINQLIDLAYGRNSL